MTGVDALLDVVVGWRPDLTAALGIAGLVALHVAGARARRPGGEGVPTRPPAFAIGVAALVLAIASPLESLAGRLLTAHMLQHLLLVLVAAPALVRARTPLTVLRTLPVTWRRRLLPPVRRFTARAGPGAVGLVALAHLLVVLTWHLPGPYTAALTRPVLHVLEHLTLVASGMAFWAAFGLSRTRPVAVAGAVSFLTALASGLLGALLSFAGTRLYPVHGDGPMAFGLSPLDDQRLAAAIMWLPGGMVYLLATAYAAVRLIEDDQRTPPAIPADPPEPADDVSPTGWRAPRG